MQRIAALGLAAVSVTFGACSMDVPHGGNRLKINLHETSTTAARLNLLSATTPTSTSDFNCFVVNVTGDGVPGVSDGLAGCSSPDNFRGRGLGMTSSETARGSSIELDLPSGGGRTIDVYGIPGDCGSTTEAYWLGGTTADLFSSTEIDIPIAFDSSAPPAQVSCGDQSPVFNTYVYAVDSSNVIHALEFDDTSGTLTDVNTLTIGGSPSKLVATALGDFLYGYDGSAKMNSYAVEPTTGAVSLGPSLAVSPTQTLAISADDTKLFNIDTTFVTSYDMFTDGSLAVGPSAAHSATSPSTVALSPDGHFGYLNSSTQVNIFSIDATTGAWTSAGTGTVTVNSVLAAHPSGSALLGGGAASFCTIPRNSSTGALSTDSCASTSGPVVEIAQDSQGTCLYAIESNGSAGSVQAYSFVSSGAAPNLKNEVTNPTNPVSGTVDPSDSWLLVADGGSPGLWTYPINADCSLASPTFRTVGSNLKQVLAVSVEQ